MNTLISKESIAKRIAKLGKEIDTYYKDTPFIMLVVLKGSFIFAADLAREIKNENMEIEFIRLSSYIGRKSSGEVKMHDSDLTKFRGKNLLIVEDIVDTGLTLSTFLTTLESIEINSIKICSLLEKKEVNKGKVKVDFLGFDISDKFVLGYGLDYDEMQRNLPEILVNE